MLKNALRDPVSGELGKSIVFAVSQNHATKLTQVRNELADILWPGKYQSDFAVQVTSLIPDAQQPVHVGTRLPANLAGGVCRIPFLVAVPVEKWCRYWYH
ncbi:MAG: hypothetical protein U1A72_15865 [Sulfuritalea sp.]|nr:hypothetical protein [Sulfuritalea sp.]